MIISSTPGLQWAQSYLNRLAALASPPTITATQRNAVFKLLSDIDTTIGLTKFKAIYPILGGSADAHALNAISSSFKITWGGTLTHDANGSKGTSSGFANTNGTPNQLFSGETSAHVTMYFNENLSAGAPISIFGASGTGTETATSIDTSIPSVAFGLNCTWSSFAWNPSDATSSGLWGCNRGSSDQRFFKNGTLKLTDNSFGTSGTPVSNQSLYLLAANVNGTASYFTTARCAFASVGSDMTNTDHANLYKAVQAYQTALGRSV